MSGYLLPLTLDPWQVMTLDLTIDGEAFHAQAELRYLPAPDQWMVTIQVHASGADAERIGKSLYDTAERYLIRTLQGVMA